MRVVQKGNRVWWLIGVGILVIIGLLTVIFVVSNAKKITYLAPPSVPPASQTQEAVLNSYGWVNQGLGAAHIPIQRAMQMVATNGFPTLNPLPTATLPPTTGGGGAGAQLFQQLGCSGCHMASNGPIAPTLNGVYNSTVTLQDGSTVKADDAYLRESILNPPAKVVKGFNPVMPSFSGKVNDQQLNDLINYIHSLGGK